MGWRCRPSAAATRRLSHTAGHTIATVAPVATSAKPNRAAVSSAVESGLACADAASSMPSARRLTRGVTGAEGATVAAEAESAAPSDCFDVVAVTGAVATPVGSGGAAKAVLVFGVDACEEVTGSGDEVVETGGDVVEATSDVSGAVANVADAVSGAAEDDAVPVSAPLT